MCVTWLVHTCDMTHIHMCDMTHSNVWHDSFICVTWLIHMCDMIRSYVWYDSSMCVQHNDESQHFNESESEAESRLNATHCDTMQHTATLCNTLQHTATRRLVLLTCRTMQYAARHTAIYCNTLQHTATHCNMQSCSAHTEWVMSHIWISHVTHVSESCHTYTRIFPAIASRDHASDM